MANILVTGGAGFIGTNFTYYWVKQHPADTIVVLDALTYAGNINNLTPLITSNKITFVHGNICDTTLVEQLLEKYNITTIVNFAAESHVDRSIQDPDVFIQSNIIGTHSLLKAAQNMWQEKRNVTDHQFHQVSTDEVYGSLDEGEPSFEETAPYRPSSPYSASKASADHLVKAYNKTFGLKTTISICSNNFGPYQHQEKFIPLCIKNLLQGKKIPIYGDGKNIREWIYVEDHCRGIESILLKGLSGETYNIGSDTHKSNLETVTCIYMALLELHPQPHTQNFIELDTINFKNDDHIYYTKDRPGHDYKYSLDSRKIREQLNFSKTSSFNPRLHETIRWFIEKLKQGS